MYDGKNPQISYMCGKNEGMTCIKVIIPYRCKRIAGEDSKYRVNIRMRSIVGDLDCFIYEQQK